MKDLSYKHMFKGKISHEDALKERVKSDLISIIMEEEGVSEKSFSSVDKIISDVDKFYTEEIFKISNEMYNQGKRTNYIAEFLYDEYYKSNISESIVTFSNFKK